MRAGPPIADLVAGLYGAIGVCAALVRRGRTGRGDAVGASLNNGMISMLAFLAANYFATGEQPRRAGNDHAIVSPYGMFRTADGEVAIAPSEEHLFAPARCAWRLPNCASDPRFPRPTTSGSRNRDAMNAAIEAGSRTDTTAYWIEMLNAAGVPCGRVHGPARRCSPTRRCWTSRWS